MQKPFKLDSLFFPLQLDMTSLAQIICMALFLTFISSNFKAVMESHVLYEQSSIIL